MKNRKLLVRGILVAAIGMALLLVVLIFCVYGSDKNLTLEKIAYDKSFRNPVVYIKEDNGYAPYLVLTSNYDGNVLLLRKHVLPESMPYLEHEPLWSHFEYASYYERSDIDKFLNTDFLETLSPDVRAAIVDTTIEVTDIESYDEWNYATHMIERKVFLLSTVELGVRGFDGSITTAEGKPLKYFRNKVYTKKIAYEEDGTARSAYWTRTPDLMETCIMLVVSSTGGIGTATAEHYLGVRPAFCMSRDTIVQKSDDVIAGESVYIVVID